MGTQTIIIIVAGIAIALVLMFLVLRPTDALPGSLPADPVAPAGEAASIVGSISGAVADLGRSIIGEVGAGQQRAAAAAEAQRQREAETLRLQTSRRR